MRGNQLGHRLVGALVGGALVATALPPLGWWPDAPVGCALLFVAVRATPWRNRLCCGWCFGIAQLSLGLIFVLQFSAVGYLVLVVAEACFFAIAAALTPAQLTGPALCGTLTLSEWVRERLPFGGLPPGGIPLATINSPLAGLARLGGAALLTLAVGACGIGLALIIEFATRRYLPAIIARRRDRHLRGDGARPALAGLGVLSAVAVLAGISALAPQGGATLGALRAVGIQGGGPRGLSQISAPSIGAFSRTYAEASRVTQRVALEVWPEDTVPLAEGSGRPDRSPLGQLLGQLARSLHATLLAGVTEPVGTTQFLNEVVGWDPSGQLAGTIEKVHAVPFGEYVPLRSLLAHFINLDAVPRDAVFGHNDGLLRTRAAPLGVLISYETFYPDRAREEVRAGARVLVVPTNTASYSNTQVPAQELAATRLAAIASGRDALQVATTGYSALVAPSGAVLKQSALGQAALLYATVPLRSGMTLYDDLGEAPTLGIALTLVLGSFAHLFYRRRREEPWPTTSRTAVGG